MLFISLLLARYPTETATWITPDVVSKWPTDTEAWGPPPTEFVTDSPGNLGHSALFGISIAAVAAAATIVVCVIFFVKGRNKARLDKKFDTATTPECNNYSDCTQSPLL